MRLYIGIEESSRYANISTVVAGASGGIGQPLSLLLKTCPLITELALYDVVNTPGVAADLSHISSPAVRTHSEVYVQ